MGRCSARDPLQVRAAPRRLDVVERSAAPIQVLPLAGACGCLRVRSRRPRCLLQACTTARPFQLHSAHAAVRPAHLRNSIPGVRIARRSGQCIMQASGAAGTLR